MTNADVFIIRQLESNGALRVAEEGKKAVTVHYSRVAFWKFHWNFPLAETTEMTPDRQHGAQQAEQGAESQQHDGRHWRQWR
jgi:hypothetical protein